MQNLLNLLDKHNISYCIKKKTELKKYIKNNKFKKDAFIMIENYNMEFKYVCISTNFPFLKSISNLKFSKLICNSEQLIYINRSLEISKLRFGINSDYDVKTSFKSFHQNDGRNIFQMFRHHYHSLDFVNILNNLKISYVIFDNIEILNENEKMMLFKNITIKNMYFKLYNPINLSFIFNQNIFY